MKNPIAGIAIFILSTHAAHAQGPLRYRNFELGSTLAAVSGLTGAAPKQ